MSNKPHTSPSECVCHRCRGTIPAGTPYYRRRLDLGHRAMTIEDEGDRVALVSHGRSIFRPFCGLCVASPS